MDSTDIMSFTVNAMILTLVLSLPPIIAATIVGTLISLLQALTQIQEQNISFAFKLVTIVIVIYWTARWLGVELYQYTIFLFDLIPRIGK